MDKRYYDCDVFMKDGMCATLTPWRVDGIVSRVFNGRGIHNTEYRLENNIQNGESGMQASWVLSHTLIQVGLIPNSMISFWQYYNNGLRNTQYTIHNVKYRLENNEYRMEKAECRSREIYHTLWFKWDSFQIQWLAFDSIIITGCSWYTYPYFLPNSNL